MYKCPGCGKGNIKTLQALKEHRANCLTDIHKRMGSEPTKATKNRAQRFSGNTLVNLPGTPKDRHS